MEPAAARVREDLLSDLAAVLDDPLEGLLKARMEDDDQAAPGGVQRVLVGAEEAPADLPVG
jgi:hypothetical protein